MAAEYSNNNSQVVQPNGSVIFTESPVSCNRGLVYHRDDSGIFRLANRFFRQNINQCWRRNTNYEVGFHANISVPTEPAGTVEPISLAISIDGEVDPSSIMTVTVPLVSDTTGDNVGADIIVTVPYLCGCSSVSVRNISTQPIVVSNANIIFQA